MKKNILWIMISILLLSLWSFYLAIRPFKISSPLTPQDFGLQYEKVAFETKDKLILKGWFIPSKKAHAKTIIFLHGYPADKGNILPAHVFLHEDYNLLFFDFRYLGESQGAYSTAGKAEVWDLRAALDYLHTRKIHEVGVWGFSLGGAVALLAAPECKEIKALIAYSPYARLDWMAEEHYRIPGLGYVLGKLLRYWGLLFLDLDLNEVMPIKALTKIEIPVLLIFSEKDEVVSFRHAVLFNEEAKGKEKVKVVITGNKGHGELVGNYEKIIKAFFDKNLK
jgi:pimeloyl-ACP methyl ester carboxylesterase